MTKQDYLIIAKVIRDTEPLNDDESAYQAGLIKNFISELRTDNKRFDEQKFKEAIYGVR